MSCTDVLSNCNETKNDSNEAEKAMSAKLYVLILSSILNSSSRRRSANRIISRRTAMSSVETSVIPLIKARSLDDVEHSAQARMPALHFSYPFHPFIPLFPFLLLIHHLRIDNLLVVAFTLLTALTRLRRLIDDLPDLLRRFRQRFGR